MPGGTSSLKGPGAVTEVPTPVSTPEPTLWFHRLCSGRTADTVLGASGPCPPALWYWTQGDWSICFQVVMELKRDMG